MVNKVNGKFIHIIKNYLLLLLGVAAFQISVGLLSLFGEESTLVFRLKQTGITLFLIWVITYQVSLPHIDKAMFRKLILRKVRIRLLLFLLGVSLYMLSYGIYSLLPFSCFYLDKRIMFSILQGLLGFGVFGHLLKKAYIEE